MSIKKQKPTILILGSFHMSPTEDMFQTELDDLLSPKRQAEIQEVVECLKNFRPTKVAVEMVTEQEEKLNESYRLYVLGKRKLKVNEIEQIGFRVAAQSSHERLYPMDWMERGVGKREFGDVYEWAQQNEPEIFSDVFEDVAPSKIDCSKTILEMYQVFNTPEIYQKEHKIYVNMARIRTEENYVGLDWLMWWYQRNLIQFANLTRLAASSDERILLIIGASHVQILQEIILGSGYFNLETPELYLNEKAEVKKWK
ncbi:DUF5694 domain-containing protein [Bacillus litorisediminis]|uniref:DUF5694 domain-containing protein n=1 Tax=Bacillus litorisediminis TaxID=2922713 RepID=UPI001FADA0EA|nr:DUF5694 domain-containing protein [Bacillus litorisediminis]